MPADGWVTGSYGGLAERINALVLKTREGHTSVGSNPTPTALVDHGNRRFRLPAKELSERAYEFDPRIYRLTRPGGSAKIIK
jgi:hypothetical protein